MSKELLKELLSSVKAVSGQSSYDDDALEQIEAKLRAAIDAPESEPVCYEVFSIKFANGTKLVYEKPVALPSYMSFRPLYASPQPAAELSDIEISQEFDKFASQFDLFGSPWLDMGSDEYFKAGYLAAQKGKQHG